jgi:cytochrome b
MMTQVRVWDLPTRVFHWLLAACIVALVVTGEIAGAALEWHMRIGYLALSLLLFRILWGFVGGRWSRFISFAYTPRTVLRYLRGEHRPEYHVGHNPLGALSVWGLLTIALLQIGAGLFSDDEIATTGPLATHASESVVRWLSTYHTAIGKWILIGLVALHVLAIAYYKIKKNTALLPPMITGDKALPDDTLPSRDTAASRIAALVLWGLCGVLVYLLITRAG